VPLQHGGECELQLRSARCISPQQQASGPPGKSWQDVPPHRPQPAAQQQLLSRGDVRPVLHPGSGDGANLVPNSASVAAGAAVSAVAKTLAVRSASDSTRTCSGTTGEDDIGQCIWASWLCAIGWGCVDDFFAARHRHPARSCRIGHALQHPLLMAWFTVYYKGIYDI